MAKPPIMSLELKENPRPTPEMIQMIVKKTGKSPLAVGWEMIRRAMRPQRLRPQEYVSYGLWRPELTKETKDQYLSLSRNRGVNEPVSSYSTDRQAAVFADKFMTATILRECGVRTPRILAAYAKDVILGQIPVLRSRETLVAFLTDPANLPYFCKPVAGSRALGSVWIAGVKSGGILVFGNGREVAAGDLADEVIANFPRGWLIQEFVQPIAEIVRRTGPALATIRLVTIWPKDESPKVFYAIWRLPAAGSMNDAVSAGTNGLALIDPASGIVSNARWGDFLTGSEIAASPAAADGTAIVGYQIPGFGDLVAKLFDAHRNFPGHGLLGWDATITDEGPMVTEVNVAPLHTMCQRITGEPFLTDANRAIFADLAAGVIARTGGA